MWNSAPPWISTCVACHNDRLKTANLTLQSGDVDLVGVHPDVWEKVARKLRTHEMPPPGRPRPDASTYSALAAQLETALDKASAANPNPGRVAVHRLNRAEYTNAVRDLLGLEVDGRALLPDDSNQESFHNIASVLSVSPALLERYLSAASQVSRLAVGSAARAAMTDTYRVPKALVQDQRTRDDLPFGSQGGTVIRHNFPVDGEYTVKVLLRRQLYYYIIGMGDPHQIEIRLDGTLLKRFDIGGEAKGRGAAESFIGQNLGDPEWEYYMQNADAGLEVRVPVKAGARDVAVSFVKQYYETTGILRPAERGFARSVDELYHGHPAVDTILIGGPYAAAGPGDTPSRRRVFTCYPRIVLSKRPARSRFSRTWPVEHIVVPLQRRISSDCSASMRPAGLKADSRPASNEVSNESWRRRVLFSVSRKSPLVRRLGRSIASAIWRSRPDCHFFSGAASRTKSSWTLRSGES